VGTAGPVVPPGRRLATRRRPSSLPVVGAAGIAAVALVLFFSVRVELWLDEALSVNIARMPLTDIPEALAQDNSAPLHYVLLHFWMAAFGTGNLAARSLSGVAVLAALPLIWLAARRVAGPRTAWTAAALLATSPFAVTYATQARMYALLILLTAMGYLALMAVLDRVTPVRLVLLGLVSGLLMLTHYWSFYLLATVVAVLLATYLAQHAARRRQLGTGPAATRQAGTEQAATSPARPQRDRRTAPLWAVAAIAGGGVLMLPWLRVFLFQISHTGTPWGNPASYQAVLDTPAYFADTHAARWYLVPPAPAGRVLALLFLLLLGWALLRRRPDRAQAGAGPARQAASQPHCLALAAVVVGTLVLAITASKLKGVALESRYLAVLLVPFLLLVATGVSLVPTRPLRLALSAALVLLGVLGSVPNITSERTHAPAIAAAISSAAEPGDVVGYCPDQLAPPVDRLLRPDLRQVTFPSGSTPERVNWTDYTDRIFAEDPQSFSQSLDRLAGPGHNVWLVWGDGYGSFGQQCGVLAAQLRALRPTAEQPIVLSYDTKYFEPSVLLRYRPRN